MKIAVFTVMLPDLTPEEAATALRDTGYDGVEWRVATGDDHPCTFRPDEAERARALTEQVGLGVPNIGTYIALGDMKKVEASLAFARGVGSPHFRIGFHNFKGNYHEHVKAARSFIRDISGLTKGSGVKPLIELHHGSIVPSASLAHRLVAEFDPDEVGIIHDAGNMVHEGFEKYLMGLELLGPYLAHVHLKNAAFDRPEGGGVWRARWSPLEDGVVDFAALFSALKAVGYDGWISLEDFSEARPSREALQHNLDFVRAALGQERTRA